MSEDEQLENDDIELDSVSSDEEKNDAGRQGWTDRDKWIDSGKDPEQWVDAKTFLERGESTLPILRSKYKNLESEFNNLKAEREKDKEIFEKFKQFEEEARKRQEKEFKAELSRVKAEKAQAVKDGDSQAFAKAEEAEEQLRTEHEASKIEPKKTESNGTHPDWEPWVADNSWYLEDEEAGPYADLVGQRLSKSSRLTGREFYEEVKKRVQKAFPDKFDNPNRSKPNAVEGATGIRNKAKGKTYSDLPADAKKACDEFIKTIPGFTKEQYLESYDWS